MYNSQRNEHQMTTKRFIIGLALGSIIAMSINKARAEPWDTPDKLLFGGFVVLQLIDVAQTNKIKQHPDQYSEKNHLYGNPPNMGRVVAFKSVTTAGIYFLADALPSTSRKFLLGAADIVQLSIDAHNYQLGLKWGF